MRNIPGSLIANPRYPIPTARKLFRANAWGLRPGRHFFISSSIAAANWPTLALFWYAPHAAGNMVDPIFGKPLNFFLFTLPAWELVNDWLLTLAIAICAVAVLFLIITSGARSVAKRQITYAPSPWRGLSITVAFLLLVLAMNVYVDRFQLLLEHHTIVDGITYTDAHVTIRGLLIVCAALVLGAVICAYNASRHSRGRWIVAAILPAGVCYGVSVSSVALHASLGFQQVGLLPEAGYKFGEWLPSITSFGL